MRKVFEQLAIDQDEDEDESEDEMEVDGAAAKKSKGKKKEDALPFMDVDVTPVKAKKEKKKRKAEDADMDVDGEESDESTPKKKVKLSKEEKKALKKEKKKERKEKEAAEVSFMNVFSCLPTLWRRMLTRTPLWLGRRVEKGEEGEEREEREEGKEGEEEQRVALYSSSSSPFLICSPCRCSRGTSPCILCCAIYFPFLLVLTYGCAWMWSVLTASTLRFIYGLQDPVFLHCHATSHTLSETNMVYARTQNL